MIYKDKQQECGHFIQFRLEAYIQRIPSYQTKYCIRTSSE
jgi:hypothetical protein